MPWTHADWIGILQAVGAIGAVIVALGIAIHQSKQGRAAEHKREIQQRAERMEAACVLATMISPKLLGVEVVLQRLTEKFNQGLQSDIGPEQFSEAVQDLRALQYRLTPEQLTTLLALPDNCSANLAFAFGRVDAIVDYLELKRVDLFTPSDAQRRKQASTECHKFVAIAYDLVLEAKRTIDAYRLVGDAAIQASQKRLGATQTRNEDVEQEREIGR